MTATDTKGCKSALGTLNLLDTTHQLHGSAHCAAYQIVEASNPQPNHREYQVSFGKKDIKKNKYTQAVFSF